MFFSRVAFQFLRADVKLCISSADVGADLASSRQRMDAPQPPSPQALAANAVIYSASHPHPPTPLISSRLISSPSCLFSVRGNNKCAHNTNNCAVEGGGRGACAALREQIAKSFIASQRCVYLNRRRENCAAISNLNCYFLSVDSLPPSDNLCVCCF